MIKKCFILGALCLLFSVARAQELKKEKWIAQSNNKADGVVMISDDEIELVRGSQGAGKYMLRVYQDITVIPGTIYQFSYKIRVEGAGSGGGLIYPGNRQGKWDGKHIKYAPRKKKCDFTEVKINVTAGADTIKFRVDLRAMGINTKVTYKGIKLGKVGANKDIVLTPNQAAVEIDGKLNDPLWINAIKLSPFRVLGNVSQNSSVKNEVMLAVKAGYLYVAYRAEEPNIKGMKVATVANVKEMQDTIGIYADDCVETFISTDQKSYTHLLVNPASIKHWAQNNIGKSSVTWYPTDKSNYTGDWEAKATIGSKEWTVEKRIKLSSLFGKNVGGEQKLFVNFVRHRTQGKESNLTWAPLTGKRNAVPKEFVPITLNLPAANGNEQQNTITAKFTKLLAVPELLITGVPVKLIKGQQIFKLPNKVVIDDKTASVDSGVLKSLNKSLAAGSGGKVKVILSIKKSFKNSALSEIDLKKLESLEAFKLELAPGKVTIAGRTKEGVLRGIATLMLLVNRAKFLPGAELPALTLYDAPRMPFRGWLIGNVDPEEVKKTIETAYLLRMNKLFISLDSYGSLTKFPFDSYPVGSKKTTKQQWIDLFNYARARGIEPIPYFASWGRIQYLKHMPGGVKLLVDDVDVIQKTYRNLDVANPETHKVMLKLQEEIIDTLKPKGFCIAMDETHYGNTVTSAAAKAKNWQASDWFIEAVNVNYAFLKKKGIKMYMYGDMIDPGYNGKQMSINGPEMLAQLPNDMVILDWKYDGKQDYTVDLPSIKMFKQAGLETIACPWFRTKNTPRLAHSVVRHNADGMCLTSWNTTQINELKPNLIRAVALTAYYSWSPEDCDLANLKFLPDALVQGAAYWNKVGLVAEKVNAIKYKNSLVSGSKLAETLGLPGGTKLDFIATPFRNYRGVAVEVFTKNGQPAAIVARGTADGVTGVVQNGKFTTDLDGWQTERKNKGKIEVANGMLKIAAPKQKTFMRALQDIRLDPKLKYRLRYKVKVDGPGLGSVWTYSGDSKFKWSSKVLYSRTKAGPWVTKEIKLPPNSAAVRICFSATKAGTTAWFDNVELLVAGAKAKKSVPLTVTVIPVNAKAKVITFMHTSSRQDLTEDMAGMHKKFMNVTSGKYEIIYSDGTKTKINLKYRVNIVAVNDKTLGREMDIGLFGTIGNSIFINLPTFTWVNPHPGKTIKAIKVIPGNSKDMALILFGISLD
jgi:hypothetical protein